MSIISGFSQRQTWNVTDQRHIKLVVYFSTTTSQKVKFCKIKPVTRDKIRAKKTGTFSLVSNFVILMAFYWQNICLFKMYFFRCES